MPATDKFWRNLKTTHVVFAASSLVLLLATLWMMADDYNDEWRGIQKTWYRLEAAKLRASQSDLQTDSFRGEVAALEEKLAAAEEDLAGNKDDLEKGQALVSERQAATDLAERVAKQARAVRDFRRANYDIGVRDKVADDELSGLRRLFDDSQDEVDRLELVYQDRLGELEESQAIVADLLQEKSALEEQLSDLRADVDRLHKAVIQIEPESWLARGKRAIMEWPIIDGFNSHLKIRQDWLPDLKIQLGMATTARFDRCRTCHLGIDQVLAGNVPTYPHGDIESTSVDDWVAANKFPHPFSTHPRPDVYLTASSPHPVPEFGCTACHEGQGSGTSFTNAAHSANDPHEHHEWDHEYGFFVNHFWEYPMFPKRFREASCLKCHHSVAELGVNPKYGPTAPKVHEGWQLLTKMGCYGCHEIHGFDAGEPIGPDLRLEPNYPGFRVAARMLLEELGEADSETARELRKLATHVDTDPLRSADQRQLLEKLLSDDKDSSDSEFGDEVHELAARFKSAEIPGKLRKVGPSLRHIAEKTTPGWVSYWTEKPSRFRPSTRMPQFFDLVNQKDAHAASLKPVELAGITRYLIDKSQPMEYLDPPADYAPDAARGKRSFERRGCLNCHVHDRSAANGTQLAEDHGPDLSKVHLKLKPRAEGEAVQDSDAFRWLYTWIREPERHHLRTRMPNLFVAPEVAADITAFLLEGESGDYDEVALLPYLGAEFDPDLRQVKVNGEPTNGLLVTSIIPMSPAQRLSVEGADATVELRKGDVVLSIGGKSLKSVEHADSLITSSKVGEAQEIVYWRSGTVTSAEATLGEPLDDLVLLYLSKTLRLRKAQEVLETNKYPIDDPRKIRGDEIELHGDEITRDMKLRYIGRRTLSRYGCYGCHDIPGFETARPIGTTLQDWGRKDTTKLALEHIAEFLEHHGEPDGSSTAHRVEAALKFAEADAFKTEEEREAELSAAFYFEAILHHERPGFLWQKLRAPRSYDYQKTETKGYDERLRMPKFPLSESEIEKIATFVLGLVAEPPAEKYVYQPTPAEADRIEGERLLAYYNCTGCHMVEMETVKFAAALDEIADSPWKEGEHPAGQELLLATQPPTQGLTGESHLVEIDGEKQMRPVAQFTGLLFDKFSEEDDPAADEYTYDVWETVDIGGKILVPGSRISFYGSDIVDMSPPRGGRFAQWLVDDLRNDSGSKASGNMYLAWQMAPPPLYHEGRKVQTPWLFRFLKDPVPLRRETVLRMPRFNLSDEEAQTLANYFAAVDGVPYPYQDIPQRRPQYLEDVGADHLDQSWRLLNANLCIKCHAVGGRQPVAGPDPAKDIRGPNLAYARDRLRPEWLTLWIYNPQRLAPYTSMPNNFPHGKESPIDLFDKDAGRQVLGIRDALMNYHHLMESIGPVVTDQPAATTDNAAGGG